MKQVPRLYKKKKNFFFLLNSAEHEILNAHKYENMDNLSFLQAQISL